MKVSDLLNQKQQLKKSIAILAMQGIDTTELERDLQSTEDAIRKFSQNGRHLLTEEEATMITNDDQYWKEREEGAQYQTQVIQSSPPQFP